MATSPKNPRSPSPRKPKVEPKGTGTPTERRPSGKFNADQRSHAEFVARTMPQSSSTKVQPPVRQKPPAILVPGEPTSPKLNRSPSDMLRDDQRAHQEFVRRANAALQSDYRMPASPSYRQNGSQSSQTKQAPARDRTQSDPSNTRQSPRSDPRGDSGSTSLSAHFRGRCMCGNVFMDDAVFCRKCGIKRPEEIPVSPRGSGSRSQPVSPRQAGGKQSWGDKKSVTQMLNAPHTQDSLLAKIDADLHRVNESDSRTIQAIKQRLSRTDSTLLNQDKINHAAFMERTALNVGKTQNAMRARAASGPAVYNSPGHADGSSTQDADDLFGFRKPQPERSAWWHCCVSDTEAPAGGPPSPISSPEKTNMATAVNSMNSANGPVSRPNTKLSEASGTHCSCKSEAITRTWKFSLWQFEEWGDEIFGPRN